MTREQFFLKHSILILFAVVFCTGAAVLVVEVTAMRILSPYFGNTLYTVSGVITVILAALALGYARGGVRADAKPHFFEFFRVICIGGSSLLVLFVLMNTLLPAVAEFFPLSWGPLVLAIVLFAAPSYFLGMLSPFAVKLGEQHYAHIGVGTISGRVFFWSTCGSIVGTLLTAFVLVPFLGLKMIIIATAVFVLLTGLLGMFLYKKDGDRAHTAIMIACIFFLASIYVYTNPHDSPNTLFSTDGVYEHLTISDTTYAGRPARFFYQDRSDSGMMYLDSPDLAAPYTQYYALYKIFRADLSRALFIGGGIYSMPSALHADLPQAQIDVAEIEPSLLSLAQKYFNAPNDPHVVNHIEDGRRFLQESTSTYDMIFSDVYYSLYSIPSHFTTQEFFRAAKSKLSPGGIFVANLIGSIAPQSPSFILSEVRTLETVFPELYVFAVDTPGIANAQNVVVLGVNSATSSPRNFTSPPSPLPSDLANHLVPLSSYNLSQYPLLTDDYSPVEYMVSRFFLPDEHTLKLLDFSSWNGDQALKDISTQVAFGPRSLGASAHAQEIQFIQNVLKKAGASVQLQTASVPGSDGKKHEITNIIGRFDTGNPRRIILGTHYDSIGLAYNDKESPNSPMPGANNGASGVALLLETARAIQTNTTRPNVGIDFVFFDGEEGARSLGAGDVQWAPLGSPYFAKHLSDLYIAKPEGAVVFDMVCDKDLSISPEASSIAVAKTNVDLFWSIGKSISPSFSTTAQPLAISDDHTALIAAGIPSFLVIDFDYAWFNTTHDTPDKCSSQSLQSVGTTLIKYLNAL